MPTIDCIKNDFAEAIINHCKERGCKLKLVDLNNYVILKGEKVCERICIERQICDCLLFVVDTDVLIGLAELKSKNADAHEIKEKLTNGLEIASSILEKCCIEHEYVNFDFYLIVLAKSWPHAIEHRKIKNTRVMFRGKEYDILPKKCGLSFLDLISRLRK
jgi:hypothetical protein